MVSQIGLIMPKKILVLGGTGLIGTALIKDFKERGHFVVNISKTNTSPYADINYLIDLSRCVGVSTCTDVEWDEIFMLSSYSTSDKMDPAYFENERENIKYLLKHHPHSSFYYASSYAVMDTIEYDSKSIKYQYRRSKQLAEKLLMVMHATGHNVHSLRIPAVYGGENNNRSIYRIVERLNKNLPVVIDNDTRICYTQDIVDFYNGHVGVVDRDSEIVSTIEAKDINLSRIVLNLKEKLNSTSVITTKITDDEEQLMNIILENK